MIFFVAGLAVADVLVGLISIPMWMYNNMLFLSSKESNNSLENIQLNSIYDALDVFAALNSIFHLTAISVERFFAAVYPRRHRQALQLLYLLLSLTI